MGQVTGLGVVYQAWDSRAAIARKATAADPAHRYPGAEPFAADITSFLDGLPVSAYRESAFERLSNCQAPPLLPGPPLSPHSGGGQFWLMPHTF